MSSGRTKQNGKGKKPKADEAETSANDAARQLKKAQDCKVHNCAGGATGQEECGHKECGPCTLYATLSSGMKMYRCTEPERSHPPYGVPGWTPVAWKLKYWLFGLVGFHFVECKLCGNCWLWVCFRVSDLFTVPIHARR